MRKEHRLKGDNCHERGLMANCQENNKSNLDEKPVWPLRTGL